MMEHQDLKAGRTVRSLSTVNKYLALTFDDGPDEQFTSAILEILAHYRVPATFFCLGSQIQKHPDVLRQMVRDGHTIGNHTWSHPYLTRESPDEVAHQLESTSAFIREITGTRPTLFRPPYGDMDDSVEQQAHALGYTVVLWNVDSVDWSGIPGPQIAANVLPNLEPGSILLHHSAGNVAGTVGALPYIIEVAHKMGYQFGTQW